MRTFILSIVSVIVIALSSFNNDTVCPTPATMQTPDDEYIIASIYDIRFENGEYAYGDFKLGCSWELSEAIYKILTDDTTAYGDFDIAVRCDYSKGICYADLLDEFPFTL